MRRPRLRQTFLRTAAVGMTTAFVIGCAGGETGGTGAAGNSGTAGNSTGTAGAGPGGSVGGSGGAVAGQGGTSGAAGASGGGNGGSATGAAGTSGTTGTGGATGAGGAGGQAGSVGAGGRGGGQAGTGGNTGSSGRATGGSSGGQAGTGATGGSGGSTAGGNPWITFDPASVVARSNIVLAHANSTASQFMPVGNGNLGAAVWAAGGFTAQLNRADTMPNRLSPGWLTIPGLAKITGASDFKGTLDLYNGVLVETGGGMTARIYVRADVDELVVDVTGADPNTSQTASVTLWTTSNNITRNPQATTASTTIGVLSESWTDNSSGATWSSNQKFGSLAALTAGGQGVTASGSGRSISVSFKPNADGSFRVVCGSPKFNGSTAATTVATQLLGSDATKANLEQSNMAWWNAFWARVGLMKFTTADGSGEYYENLRAVFLFAHAGESRGERPGSQAGVADFYHFDQDYAQWYPAGYWIWNIRMQVAAAMTSGAFELNAPLFNLYASNVANIQAWTKSQMGGRAGICVPETMRFNGNGYWYSGNHSCDEASSPSYNALTLSSGSEIGLWMWRHYLMTQDKSSLQTNFPFMLEAARFLHTYATTGSDGKLQTSPTNAHEQQWAVTTSINDVSAMRAFFPAVVSAAQIVGSTDSLISALQTDITKLPDLPRTNTSRSQATTPSSDSTNIFANSTQPTATTHNVENDDLEPVWPYDLVSDSDANLLAIAKRTYSSRAYKDTNDWSNDAITAARLGLASEVPARLSAIISKYQAYACGLAAFDTTSLQEPYIEAIGVLTTAINEAVATGFDGIIRLAPALPTNWSASGTVYVQGKSKVHVQFVNGALAFGVLEAGTTGTVNLRNPWSGTLATVLDSTGAQVVAPSSAATLAVSVQQGRAYLIKRSSDATPSPIQVTGTAATAVKKLNSRTIGVP